MNTLRPVVSGVIDRLVATPESEGGFDYVDPFLTDDNFPALAEPSLEGARLDPIVASESEVALAALKRVPPRRDVSSKPRTWLELLSTDDFVPAEPVVGDHEVTLAAVRRDGRRPATLHELLLFGIKHPEEQRKYCIWSLAKVWIIHVWDRDGAFAPFLSAFGDGGDRDVVFANIRSCMATCHRVLTYPMTPEELALRDAEDAARNNA